MICYVDKVRHDDGPDTFVSSIDFGPGITKGEVEHETRHGAVQRLKSEGCRSWIVRVTPPVEIVYAFGEWDGDPPALD